ncbi:glycosyltransferase family 2 protein [Novosphingobium huizhouense]|uniref:glycosyltransferase family 2 protein n=1 Tax=Novosphingobium huizhouense TaxID=2866625 RepID=UPI001CD8A511|nr:glycosyltransferase family A protein [Novosphingobium huizhouense]
MAQDDELISVIVPAYNAETTLIETLRSISAQSHAAIEVLVIDDGSSDRTAELAERYAREYDQRVRTVRQDNAGVAAARNKGAALARSDLLAFVDADDLWAPDKLARQRAVLEAAGPQAGLCYTWYAMIDAESRIFYCEDFVERSGWLLDALLITNFIGNGSSALVRRAAFEAARGFDPALRAAGAQGCEDILFYCRVAEHYAIVVVPDYLVGYRQYRESMSGDLAAMLRSWLLVVDEMRARHPGKERLLREGVRRYGRWLVRRAIHWRRPVVLTRILARLALAYPAIGARLALVEAPRTFYDRVRPAADAAAAEGRPAPRARFAIGADYLAASTPA